MADSSLSEPWQNALSEGFGVCAHADAARCDSKPGWLQTERTLDQVKRLCRGRWVAEENIRFLERPLDREG